MYSSYSPLFTLGLLAEHSPLAPSPPSSSSPLKQAPLATANADDASAIYFTLQTGKRDTVELRSFLYLDLADHKHAPSHRRKFSLLSKSTSWTCAADVKSVYDFARTEKPIITMAATPVAPARRRTSKESLRNIPSPKPAPSTTLPDPPIASDSRLLLSSAPPSSSKKRPASIVISSPLSPTRVRRPVSLRSESVSHHHRRKSRMDALACLEGRSRVPNRIPRLTTVQNDFMSFSDDEDEKITRKSGAPSAATTLVLQIEDLSAFADVEDEADAIIPTHTRKRESADPAEPARPAKLGRKRRSTLESWFPLKSFIDFKDDDLSSWNWRSFIEIGGVS